MDIQPCVIWLDGPQSAVQAHASWHDWHEHRQRRGRRQRSRSEARSEAAVPPIFHKETITTEVAGPCVLLITGQSNQYSDSTQDVWLGAALALGDREGCTTMDSRSFPAELCFSLHLRGVKDDGTRCDLGFCARRVPAIAWLRYGAYGCLQVARWSALRAAVQEGYRLQVKVMVLGSELMGADDSVAVPSPPAGLAASSMLNGPFSDVVIRAGGREFRAHRVVLAAASPVFLSMLAGGMQEAREAAVELQGVGSDTVELLLRYIYGDETEVSFASAVALCALADQYQLHSGLADRLHLWISTVQVEPELLCSVLAAMQHHCSGAIAANLMQQAAECLDELWVMPEFTCWTLEVLEGVIGRARPALGMEAAAAWVGAAGAEVEAASTMAQGAQQAPEQQRQSCWSRLLDAIRWDIAERVDIELMSGISCPGGAAGAQIPGLEARLRTALDALCSRVDPTVVALALSEVFLRDDEHPMPCEQDFMDADYRQQVLQLPGFPRRDDDARDPAADRDLAMEWLRDSDCETSDEESWAGSLMEAVVKGSGHGSSSEEEEVGEGIEEEEEEGEEEEEEEQR